MFKLIKAKDPKRLIGIYRYDKFVELWVNDTSDFYWIKFSDGKDTKTAFGWDKYEEAELQFNREIYNLQIKGVA